MAIHAMVCVGEVDADLVSTNFLTACKGTYQLLDISTIVPAQQPESVMTQATVETMFLSAVSVLLLATAFKLVRKQFFK